LDTPTFVNCPKVWSLSSPDTLAGQSCPCPDLRSSRGRFHARYHLSPCEGEGIRDMPAEMPQTRTSLVSELRVSTPAAGFFAASFLHRTSRAPDPHVHSGIEDRGRRIAANPDIPGQPAAAISVPTSPHDTTTSLHCWLPRCRATWSLSDSLPTGPQAWSGPAYTADDAPVEGELISSFPLLFCARVRPESDRRS